MAFMSQEHKARIQIKLRAIIPASWKWSLSVRHHSTLILTIYSAPVDLIEAYTSQRCSDEVRDACRSQRHMQVNSYHWREHFTGELAEIFGAIMAAMNTDNHDRSDFQTDYFDVGHYVEVNFGKWDRKFQVSGQFAQAA